VTKHQHTGFTRIIKAFGYSLEGLRAAYATEAAFRQELWLCAVAIPIACWLDVTTVERALLIGSLFLVLIAELLNTAIETIIERISPDIHPLSKKAKDIGSAVVLMSLLGTAGIWGIIVLS
jgi:diacylglycerol kinase (ATP)